MIYRVFRGSGMGFQGLEFKRSRSGSSAAPFWHPEADHVKYKKTGQLLYASNVCVWNIY
jgi:hypothetical protein